MQAINDIPPQTELPIFKHRQEIIQAIAQNQVVIIAGETGSGKTTQLPKYCLEAGQGQERVIACTQPRRLAAISVAARVAEELGEVGRDIVAYKIRFQDHTSNSTRIKFLTDGMLLAEAQHDRFLKRYDTIIIDEAHERSLNIDFLLGILKKLLTRRRDLKVIVSSATLDVQKFAKYFNAAPIIEVSGRSYPIEDIYLSFDADDEHGELSHIDLAVQTILTIEKERQRGDILTFMPTERDVMEVSRLLAKKNSLRVMPLFGRMSGKEQSKIFRPIKGRKVVVATNVAETSITVPGIRFVIDSGLARISGYNPRTGTSQLPVSEISRASADQRRGRCGRVGPGICYRLYSEEQYLNRPEFTPPEIVRSNLAEVILRMFHLNLGTPRQFPFVDPPNSRSIRDGFKLLEELGAIKGINQPQLTKRGKFMARLPVDPKISRMILEASSRNCLNEILVISAALSIQDPRVRPLDKSAKADLAHAEFNEPGSDFYAFLKIWRLYNRTAKKVQSKGKLSKFCKANFLSYLRMREWCDIYEQLSHICDKNKFSLNAVPASSAAIHQAILSGSLRNIALKKQKRIYLGRNGREMMIFPGSSLFKKSGAWIMASEIVETSKTYARVVANIEPEWIEPLAGNLCSYSYSNPHWEKKKGMVVATVTVSLFGLILSAQRKTNYGRINPQEARQIFIQTALVEAEIRQQYKFHGHNLELIKSLQDIEQRLRRKNVVDEYQIFQFYEQHLPDDVVDIMSLERVLPRISKRLHLQEADVLQSTPHRDQLDQFPGFIQIEGYRLQLSYRFAPGTIEDGVSVLIPIDIIEQIDPAPFEWLVPGLILEKIVWLLKGLPKKIRKKLLPIADTANRISQELEFGEGRLLTNLESMIWRRLQVKIIRTDWQKDKLPDHLNMRYCLVCGQKVLRYSRKIHELLEEPLEAQSSRGANDLRQKYERLGVSAWDFADLPERLPIYGSNKVVTSFIYPGLQVENQNSLAVKLFPTEQERDKQTELGMVLLYKLHLKNQVKEAGKRFRLEQADWPLFEGLATNKEMNGAVLQFIFRHLFQVHGGPIVSKEKFCQKVDRMKDRGMLTEGQKIFDAILEILLERRLTIDHIHKYESKVPKGQVVMRQILDNAGLHMAKLLSFSFFMESREKRIYLLPRYFKALRIRVERAYVNQKQDQQKCQMVAPFEEMFQESATILAKPKLAEQQKKLQTIIDEFWIMVEEFKVSIFAQELKTSLPVSPKRLKKKWQEVVNSVEEF